MKMIDDLIKGKEEVPLLARLFFAGCCIRVAAWTIGIDSDDELKDVFVALGAIMRDTPAFQQDVDIWRNVINDSY